MPITANTIIARTQRVYADLDSTTALAYLNDVDEEVLMAVPWRRTSRAIPLVAGTSEYALLETEIRIWTARLLMNGSFDNEKQLAETSFDSLDLESPGWRSSEPGTPSQYYASTNGTTGVLGLYRAPEWTSLTISGVTATNPIVVTTQTHGLSDGDQVYIQGVVGVPEANGRFYVNIPGVSTTTFELYRDSGLADSVSGSGSYTSGGAIAAPGKPLLIVETTLRADYTGAENFPTTPHLRDLYVAGLCRRFAMERDQQKLTMWDQLFSARLSEFSRAFWGRAAKFRPSVVPTVVKQSGWRS